MIIDVKIPSPGESITSVVIAGWLVKDGDTVSRDQEILEIDSDKATLTISAPEAGKIKILAAEGDTVEVGASVAHIDTSMMPSEPISEKTEKRVETNTPSKEAQPSPQSAEPPKTPQPVHELPPTAETSSIRLSPLARKLMQERKLNEQELTEFFKNYRFVKEDIEFYLEQKSKTPSFDAESSAIKLSIKKDSATRETSRQKMSALRQKLSERLVAVKNETAMLTTFNEVNMTPIMELRKKYKDAFQKKFGVSLGFMSFFTKACAIALEAFPQVNAMIDGDEIVFHHFADIGIAVSTPKGLMVPVLRNAETLSLAEIELKIKDLATRARDKKISLEELSGGTFTITNGGVFGSLLSTPIINPPQSAILGMHNILERPIAVNGKVEIHPMMYVALSYDHRIIDGRESVSFLVMVKNLLENPVRMLTQGADPESLLLEL
ncbi:MAG: 2-oxoglutarate dehydrogenase complex dihydrolipoyllysine-residue succinyltransferase [Bacteroidales bacterium]